MKRIYIPLVSFGVAACLANSSCQVEDYYLDDLSTDSLVITPSVGAPIGRVDITMADVFKHDRLKGQLMARIEEQSAEIDFEEHGLDNNIALPILLTQGTDVTASDTLDDLNFDEYLGSGKAVDDIDIIQLKFALENGIPLNADLNLYFLDSLNQIIDDEEIHQNITIDAAKVGANYKPSSSTSKNVVVEYTGKNIKSLSKAQSLKIDYVFRMPDSECVYVDSTQTLHVNIKAYAKATSLVNEYE